MFRSLPAVSRLLLALVILPATTWSAEFEENFANVPEGALLTTTDGWVATGEDTWTVSSANGFEGGALEAVQTGKYQLELLEKDFAIRAEEGPVTFRAKINITAPVDSYSDIRLDLCKSGGVHGIGLRFKGGNQNGVSDNSIGLSEGGASWGVIEYRTVDNSSWQTGVWYQVEFKDLQFGADGITATATVYPVDDPSSKLVDGEEIRGYGGGNVRLLDLLAVSSVGAARSFLVDDLQIVPAEE